MHFPREHINIDLTLLVLVNFDVRAVVKLYSRVAPVLPAYEHIDPILTILVHILNDSLLEDFICRALVTDNLCDLAPQIVVIFHLILCFLMLDVFHLPLGFLVALLCILVIVLGIYRLFLHLFIGVSIDSFANRLCFLQLFGAIC